MKIVRITIGVLEDGAPAAYQIEPHREGLTIAATGARPAEAIAASVRHVLARPEPRSSQELPFVRVALEVDELQIEVADDAVQSMRMLAESRSGALPLMIEANAKDDVAIEALLLRIRNAAGLADLEQLAPALAMRSSPPAGEATKEELAYVEAQRYASQLAAAVRQIDDRMTASVVPDWLWIATGFGGLGVSLTTVVFLFPESRIFLIPALIALSTIGFGLYGWRSWRELRVRGGLQVERAELRARREIAREEARQRRASLAECGGDPDAAMVRLQGLIIPKTVPAVFSREASSVAELLHDDRQTIVFVDGAVEHARAVRFSRVAR